MVTPEIGLSMLFCLGEPFSIMTERITDAETTYIEIVDEGYHSLDKKRVALLKDLGKSHGLKYMVHAPFAGMNIALSSKPLLNAMLRRLKRSIINASALDCKTWVFHPGLRTGISMFYPKADWTRNLESVRILFNFARDYGVEAAIENVVDPFIIRKIKDFRRFFREVYEDVGLTLDIGHANIIGQLDDFLMEFSDRIVHIHAHDNHGKKDQHLGIGYGNVDWKRVASLLKRMCYDKIVTIETVEHVNRSMQKMRNLLL
jgi:sugar phosphate isomerase/epimerase